MKPGKVFTAAALLAATTSMANVSAAQARNNQPAKEENQALKATAPAKIETEAFVQQASQGNIFEIETSKIAVEKSMHPEVKEFAQQLIDDHSKANAELTSTVPTAGVSQEALAKTLDTDQQKVLQSLKNSSQEDFDRQYLQAQADAHKKTIELFNQYAENGDNQKIREFAARTLPKLQHHKDEVAEVKEERFGGKHAH